MPPVSNKWRGLHGPITAAVADAEPEHDQLFGPSFGLRQRQLRARGQQSGIDKATYRPWKKPTIERAKR